MGHIVSKWKFWGVLVALLLIVGLILVLKPKATGSQAAGPAPLSVIKIAIPDLSANSNHSSGVVLTDYIYLNQLLEQKFAKHNIKIEWLFFKGAGPAINEALVNHQVDVAFLGDLAMLIGKANQIDSKLIAAVARQSHSHLGVIPKQGYDSLEKLKGKRIAVWQGTAAHLSFYQFIQAHGFSDKDFRLVNLDAAAINAALASKKIDAGWGMMNILSLAEKNVVEVPLRTRDQKNGIGTIQFGLIAQNQFIQAHPEITQELVNTLVEAAHWVAQTENRTQGIDLVSHNAGYPQQIYARSFEGQSLKDIHNPLLDEFYLARLQAGIDTALQTKLIKQGFDLNTWVEAKFVNQAIKQLGYEQYW